MGNTDLDNTYEIMMWQYQGPHLNKADTRGIAQTNAFGISFDCDIFSNNRLLSFNINHVYVLIINHQLHENSIQLFSSIFMYAKRGLLYVCKKVFFNIFRIIIRIRISGVFVRVVRKCVCEWLCVCVCVYLSWRA